MRNGAWCATTLALKVPAEERLRTAFDISPEASRSLVPPLMIQTLVENAMYIAEELKGWCSQSATNTQQDDGLVAGLPPAE